MIHEFRFTAIAFGTNWRTKCRCKDYLRDTESELKNLGYDVEEVIMLLQRKLTSRET